MAAKMHGVQFPLENCDIHFEKELHGYCKTCKMKICASCIKQDHNSHDWELIVDILKEKRRALPQECHNIRIIQLPSVRKEIERFDREIKEADNNFERNKSTLNQSRKDFIDEVNKSFDEMIDDCQRESETAKYVFKEKRDVLKGKLDRLELMTTSLDKDILTLPGIDVIDMELDMRDELKKAQSFISEIYTHATVFVPGKMDEKVLNDMIGHIHKMSLGEINEIDRYSSPIVSIKAFSDTKAITRLKNDQYAKIISSTGEELGVVGAPCTDIIALNNGHLVLIGYMEALVSLLNNNGDEIRSFDTKPLRPYRISKTENDDILVSLRDFDGDFTLQPTSRRVIQRMHLTGKVLHTYEFREDGKTRLFTLPTGIAENKNTDVCVVNRLANDRGELIALHKDGRVKFTYSGDRLLSKMFAPLDVACDEKCHIMITEWYSKGVHVLNSKGIYLCELCQFERFHPSELSLFGETLWCGYREGNIKVFQYRH